MDYTHTWFFWKYLRTNLKARVGDEQFLNMFSLYFMRCFSLSSQTRGLFVCGVPCWSQVADIMIHDFPPAHTPEEPEGWGPGSAGSLTFSPAACNSFSNCWLQWLETHSPQLQSIQAFMSITTARRACCFSCYIGQSFQWRKSEREMRRWEDLNKETTKGAIAKNEQLCVRPSSSNVIPPSQWSFVIRLHLEKLQNLLPSWAKTLSINLTCHVPLAKSNSTEVPTMMFVHWYRAVNATQTQISTINKDLSKVYLLSQKSNIHSPVQTVELSTDVMI